MLTLAAAVVGVVWGWGWLERELKDYATQTHSRPVTVALAQRPAWLSDSTARKLKQTAAEWVSPDPMDRVSLHAAASALAQSPWIERVEQVRRAAGGRVIVQATYRQPLAAIRTDHGTYVVDGQGVWLPTGDVTYLDQLPVIQGVGGSAPRQVGEAWTGDDVTAGLALVALLRDEPYLNQIESINVAGRDRVGRVQVVLYSRYDGWVLWGLAPGREKMSEVEASVKLARLRDVVRKTGTIDARGQGLYLNTPTIMTARAER